MAFFEKMGETISSKTILVANKAKEITDISNLNSQIKTCEEIVQKNYSVLGKAYYDAYKDIADDKYSTQCEVISEALKSITNLKEQIYSIKGIKVCAGCGGEIPSSNIFCPNCGKRAETLQKED